MLPNEKLVFEQSGDEKDRKVKLKGVIDEDSNFEPISRMNRKITFNFKEVKSINSIGIRTWVNFLKELSGSQIFFEACPPIIVRQMNMIPSFKGHATVISVFAPYICNSCESENMALVSREKFDAVLESVPCPQCKKGVMELDGHPQQYFAFAK